jgi:hypothetical protein
VWNGASSTDWFTTTNWCGSLPSSTVGALIPSGVTAYPVIGANGAAVNDLSIISGASLGISSPRSLAAYGDWTNDGTFSPVAPLMPGVTLSYVLAVAQGKPLSVLLMLSTKRSRMTFSVAGRETLLTSSR